MISLINSVTNLCSLRANANSRINEPLLNVRPNHETHVDVFKFLLSVFQKFPIFIIKELKKMTKVVVRAGMLATRCVFGTARRKKLFDVFLSMTSMSDKQAFNFPFVRDSSIQFVRSVC